MDTPTDFSDTVGDDSIFLGINGQVSGPFSRADVLQMPLAPDTLVCADGCSWIGIGQWRDTLAAVSYPVVTPVAGAQALPVVQPVTGAVVQPADLPVVQPAAEPAGLPVVQPVIQSAVGGTFVQSSINPVPLENAVSGRISDNLRICPHCGTPYDTGKINYISVHPDLIGDPLLGADAPRRFLPEKFNAQGYAIDAGGMVCKEMACPHCHQRIPDACCQLPGCTFSIVGAPSCGKSYFMTAMIWQLRNVLASKFDFSLQDTDEQLNSVLNEYEKLLFLNRDRQKPVSLPKTEEYGANYSNTVFVNNMQLDLPRPFIFTLIPQDSNLQWSHDDMTNVIFYDNAGEHFAPGKDTISNLATQHLVHSQSVTFLFDPLQDARMVEMCSSEDPQLTKGYSSNQLVLFNEMVSRIRKYTGLGLREKCSKTLIVVIPKYDAWQKMFPCDLRETPFVYYSRSCMQNFLDIGVITAVSFQLREMLVKLLPDVVSMCESCFESVYFVPVSSLGHTPELQDSTIAIKPGDIAPVWAEVPALIQFYNSGLIPGVDSYSSTHPDSEVITGTISNGSTLLYSLPGIRERFSIPANYCGYTVWSDRLGKYISFPEITVRENADDDCGSGFDDNFWNTPEA